MKRQKIEDRRGKIENKRIREIVIATRNKKKLGEIKEITSGLKLKVVSLDDFPYAPYVKEDRKTFLENAQKKALTIARFTRKLTLGEDSGLCIDALLGAPGIYSSRFSGKSKSDLKNNQKVLRLLKDVPFKKRAAHYVCAVALADKDGLIGAVSGKCNGFIGFKPQGTHGFGYDPLFFIPKYKKTFAQLGEKVKHRMSHRYRALQKTKALFKKYYKNDR